MTVSRERGVTARRYARHIRGGRLLIRIDDNQPSYIMYYRIEFNILSHYIENGQNLPYLSNAVYTLSSWPTPEEILSLRNRTTLWMDGQRGWCATTGILNPTS